jgi:hypothetical protein
MNYMDMLKSLGSQVQADMAYDPGQDAADYARRMDQLSMQKQYSMPYGGRGYVSGGVGSQASTPGYSGQATTAPGGYYGARDRTGAGLFGFLKQMPVDMTGESAILQQGYQQKAQDRALRQKTYMDYLAQVEALNNQAQMSRYNHYLRQGE